MAVTLDISERYLTDADGVIRAMKHSPELIARITALSFGPVYQAGVGTGELRQALLALVTDGTVVFATEATESNSDVLAYYEGLYPDDTGNVLGTTVPLKLADHIDPADPMGPSYTWTMGILDFTVEDLSSDSGTIDSLKTIWPNPGGRLLVLSERSDLIIDGWVASEPEAFGTTFLYVFDRHDPANGVGVQDPFGTVYVPGFGWH